MSLDLVKFRDIIFKNALDEGFENAEIFFSRSNNFEVRMFQKEVNSYKNTDVWGISFRGVYKGVMGYSFSERVDESVIPFLIKSAKENANIIEDKEKEQLYIGDKHYDEISTFNHELEKITIQQKMKDVALMETIAYEESNKVISVDSCVIGTGSGETFIANTLGLDLKSNSNFAIAYITVRVKDADETKLDMDYWVGNDYSQFSPEKIAKNAVKKALSNLGAKQVKTGSYKVIIENETFIDFFKNFISLFFAENVQKGFSLLKDKVGTKIANSIITIKDDALLKNHLGSSSFDSEGVRTMNKNVVENGILKTYLYNTKSAKKDNVSSTGNGFKSNFKAYVTTSGTNFYIENGNISFDGLLREMGNGLVINDLSGLHSGINPISGDFSLLAAGFVVDNGRITNPVEQITIAGNFFELMKNIVNIGNDLKFGTPSAIGNIGSPSVYVGNLDIAGE